MLIHGELHVHVYVGWNVCYDQCVCLSCVQQELWVRDCIIVRSGKRKQDRPYIAKVGSIWKEDTTGNTATGLGALQKFIYRNKAGNFEVKTFVSCRKYSVSWRKLLRIVNQKCRLGLLCVLR